MQHKRFAAHLIVVALAFGAGQWGNAGSAHGAGSGVAGIGAGPLHKMPSRSGGMIRKIAVFGDDNRVPLPANLAELSHSVGLLSSAIEKTVCSAFCVGRSTIATAAHCVFRTAGERRGDLASFRFEVGPIGEKLSAGVFGRQSRTYRQHVIAGSVALAVTPPIDATNDWALMRLDRPICEKGSLLVSKAAPDRISALAERNRLMHVAFHGDFKHWQLAVSRSCATNVGLDRAVQQQVKRDFADVAALVLHDCDTGLASSGSPLMALAPDNSLRVVAINVGTYQQTRYLVTRGSVTRRFKPATVANTAISGSAFADHVLAFTRADILNSSADVQQLQIALNAKGFDAGSADGVYGERTRRAVVAFEIATGRAGIGLATHQLLAEIKRHHVR